MTRSGVWRKASALIDMEGSQRMFMLLRALRLDAFPRTAILALLGIGAASPLAMAQATAATDTAATIYKANCVICHGEDGSGTPLGIRLKAKDLRSKEVQDKTSKELAETIHTGKGNMPAFGTRLESDQIDKLVEYVRQKK
jgi:mono/diheme cytochrome c family protein